MGQFQVSCESLLLQILLLGLLVIPGAARAHRYYSLTDALCLAFFDQQKPVTLQVDASNYELRGALLQENTSGKLLPVAYMSCQLKPNKVQWAQIEKEALAICAACHKWDLWLYDKAIIVHSDHQALETIFKKPLEKAPKCLQRIMFR